MKTCRLKSERGIATIIAILMVGVLMLLGLAAMNTSNDEISIAGNNLNATRAFYAAEAGLEVASAAIQAQYDSTGAPPSTMPAGSVTLNSTVTAYTTTDGGPATQKVLTEGTLAGLIAMSKTYSIQAIGVNQIDGSEARLSQRFNASLIPIFQFAVFYQGDLEVSPNPPMTLSGRVHSNGNMYLQSDNGLDINSYVSCAQSIFHGTKTPARPAGSGNVRMKDGSGSYVSMKSGSSWIDHNYSTWTATSTSMWDGRVQDQAHGAQSLNIPLSTAGGPRKLIEPATGNPDSYENKATLKIVNNVAWQKSGSSWVNVTAAMTAAGIITYSANKFTDLREGKQIDVTEIDVAKLYAQGYAPSNGVLYFSDDISSGTEFPGLRLVNGSTLGAPLTVASQNPLYTKGDFNSVNKKPCALMADAITFLSSAFTDAKSAMSLSNRIANATTVNCAYMSGNTNSTSSNFNGGLENLPRFLEDWSGKNLNWIGSAICLWNSGQATGNWDGSYYDAPNRVWSFDTDFLDPNKLPPQTPTVRVFQRSNWSEEFVGGTE